MLGCPVIAEVLQRMWEVCKMARCSVVSELRDIVVEVNLQERRSLAMCCLYSHDFVGASRCCAVAVAKNKAVQPFVVGRQSEGRVERTYSSSGLEGLVLRRS